MPDRYLMQSIAQATTGHPSIPCHANRGPLVCHQPVDRPRKTKHCWQLRSVGDHAGRTGDFGFAGISFLNPFAAFSFFAYMVRFREIENHQQQRYYLQGFRERTV